MPRNCITRSVIANSAGFSTHAQLDPTPTHEIIVRRYTRLSATLLFHRCTCTYVYTDIQIYCIYVCIYRYVFMCMYTGIKATERLVAVGGCRGIAICSCAGVMANKLRTRI